MVVEFAVVGGYLAMKVADKVTDGLLTYALGLIIKTNQEQLSQLGKIDQKLSALLQGPFNTGMNYMEQAGLPHRTASEQQAYLRRALDEFNRALGNETDNLERKAWIRWHIALCHEMLNEHEDAKYHFAKCSEEAKEALAQMRVAYEAEMQQHNKAMKRVDPSHSWWWGIVFIVVTVALIIYFIWSGQSLEEGDAGNIWKIVFVVGVIVLALVRMLMSANQPKPLDQRISPIMESLIKSVDHVRGMPGFASALPDAA